MTVKISKIKIEIDVKPSISQKEIDNWYKELLCLSSLNTVPVQKHTITITITIDKG